MQKEESYEIFGHASTKLGVLNYARKGRFGMAKCSLIMEDEITMLQSLTADALDDHDYEGVQHWMRYKNHVYIGRQVTPRKEGELGENHLDCTLHLSYFYNPYPFKFHPYIKVSEMTEFNLRGCFNWTICNNAVISRLRLLKGKTLGCFCHTVPWECHDETRPEKNWRPLDSELFGFKCHGEILFWLIEVLEHPEGHEFWKITDEHWDFKRHFYDPYLRDDMKNYVLNKAGYDHHDPDKETFLVQWRSKKCIKKSGEEFREDCLCYACRKHIYMNGHKFRSDSALYHSSDTACLDYTRQVMKFIDYMYHQRANTGLFDFRPINHHDPRNLSKALSEQI